MKTFYSKSILVVFLFLGITMTSLNAEEILVVDDLKIELAAGFTIEDIIQDLHDNANITDITVFGTNTTYTIKYSPKVVDITALITYLNAHKGVKKVIVE